VLGVQGTGVEEAPVCAVILAIEAVSHGDQHAGREHPSVKNLEQLSLDTDLGQHPRFEVLDVAL
jgi:hypothetical protein